MKIKKLKRSRVTACRDRDQCHSAVIASYDAQNKYEIASSSPRPSVGGLLVMTVDNMTIKQSTHAPSGTLSRWNKVRKKFLTSPVVDKMRI